MTDKTLSPAAQAVMDAWDAKLVAGTPCSTIDPELEALAAALRVAASHLTSAKASNQLRAIADELEGIND